MEAPLLSPLSLPRSEITPMGSHYLRVRYRGDYVIDDHHQPVAERKRRTHSRSVA
jgi:hypothetical protein